MDQNDVISMHEVKQKLARLKEILPNAPSHLFEFGQFLSTYLFNNLRPQEYVEELRMAIDDLKVGRNGFTSSPITGPISRHSRFVYDAMKHDLGRISEAVLPDDVWECVQGFLTEDEKHVMA